MGFERSKNEPSLYIKCKEDKELIVVCLYVDDMIYFGTSNVMVKEFKEKMLIQLKSNEQTPYAV